MKQQQNETEKKTKENTTDFQKFQNPTLIVSSLSTHILHRIDSKMMHQQSNYICSNLSVLCS